MAAKYIYGNKQFSGIATKLSGVTKNLTTGIISDPHKMENIINLVRTAAPLTSTQTVTKVNTYLPAFEKFSTLIGMYSFLNRAQNYSPIQPLGGKSPVEKITALMQNGSLPIGKVLAQPLLANNMEKIMSNVAKDMIKNGNFSEILSSMTSQFAANQQNTESSNSGNNNNIDINSLIQTFMPIINNMSTDKELASNNNDKCNSLDDESEKKTDKDDFDAEIIFEEPKFVDKSEGVYDPLPKKNDKIPSSRIHKEIYENKTPIHIKRKRRRVENH